MSDTGPRATSNIREVRELRGESGERSGESGLDPVRRQSLQSSDRSQAPVVQPPGFCDHVKNFFASLARNRVCVTNRGHEIEPHEAIVLHETGSHGRTSHEIPLYAHPSAQPYARGIYAIELQEGSGSGSSGSQSTERRTLSTGRSSDQRHSVVDQEPRVIYAEPGTYSSEADPSSLLRPEDQKALDRHALDVLLIRLSDDHALMLSEANQSNEMRKRHPEQYKYMEGKIVELSKLKKEELNAKIAERAEERKAEIAKQTKKKSTISAEGTLNPIAELEEEEA